MTGPRVVAAEAVAVLCMLGALVFYVEPTLSRPLLEKHAWRQTQTAFTARVFHEEGIDLLHPKTPVFGEPWEVPFEFPLFQAGAAVVMELGMEEDRALRVTALLCFLVTALLLYGLVRHVAGRAAGIAALAAFVFTPFAIVWSRASMIEYLATAGAVAFALALILWREQRRPLWAGLALVAGLVGMLVKPTTAIFWIAPALAYRTKGSGGRLDRGSLVTGVLVALPLAAAAAWTRHADAVKAASPATAWLTSSELSDWNFGGLGQRFELETWDVIGARTGNLVNYLVPVFLVTLVAMWRSPQRAFWVGIASAALLPPLVFTNLYVKHDYYLAAIAPALAALIGLGAGYVWSRLPRRPVVLAGALVAGVLLLYGTLEFGRGYWLRVHGSEDDPQVLPLARELESRTGPDDRIAVVGLEWSPAVLYYAHRRGHMLVPENQEASLDLIDERGYRDLLVGGFQAPDDAFLSRWRWVGARGQHLYSLADSARELAPSLLLATDAAAPSGERLVGERFALACDRTATIPYGERGTWIRFGRATVGARLLVGDFAPLPVRRFAFVSQELARDGRLSLSCSGARSLPVLEVVSAPPP